MTVRFYLKFPEDYDGDTSNIPVSRCIARVVQSLSRKDISSSYIWVREQATSEHPHFHCAVLVNGQKSQNPYRVLKLAENQWQKVIQRDISGLTHYCTRTYDGNPLNNGIMIRKNKEEYSDKLCEVKAQLSYLAKVHSKGTPLDGVRDFGMSRLK